MAVAITQSCGTVVGYRVAIAGTFKLGQEALDQCSSVE